MTDEEIPPTLFERHPEPGEPFPATNLLERFHQGQDPVTLIRQRQAEQEDALTGLMRRDRDARDLYWRGQQLDLDHVAHASRMRTEDEHFRHLAELHPLQLARAEATAATARAEAKGRETAAHLEAETARLASEHTSGFQLKMLDAIRNGAVPRTEAFRQLLLTGRMEHPWMDTSSYGDFWKAHSGSSDDPEQAVHDFQLAAAPPPASDPLNPWDARLADNRASGPSGVASQEGVRGGFRRVGLQVPVGTPSSSKPARDGDGPVPAPSHDVSHGLTDAQRAFLASYDGPLNGTVNADGTVTLKFFGPVSEAAPPSGDSPAAARSEVRWAAFAVGPDGQPRLTPVVSDQGRLPSALGTVGRSIERGLGDTIAGPGTLDQAFGDALRGGNDEQTRAEMASLQHSLAGLSQLPDGPQKEEVRAFLQGRYEQLKSTSEQMKLAKVLPEFGRAVREDAERRFETNPAYAGEFWADTAPSVVGSTVEGIVPFLAGPEAGVPAAFAQNYQTTFDENKAHGADDETAAWRALFNAIVSGGLESVGNQIVAGAFARLARGKAALGALAEIAKGTTAGAVSGAGQETARQFINHEHFNLGAIVKQGALSALGAFLVSGGGAAFGKAVTARALPTVAAGEASGADSKPLNSPKYNAPPREPAELVPAPEKVLYSDPKRDGLEGGKTAAENPPTNAENPESILPPKEPGSPEAVEPDELLLRGENEKSLVHEEILQRGVNPFTEQEKLTHITSAPTAALKASLDSERATQLHPKVRQAVEAELAERKKLSAKYGESEAQAEYRRILLDPDKFIKNSRRETDGIPILSVDDTIARSPDIRAANKIADLTERFETSQRLYDELRRATDEAVQAAFKKLVSEPGHGGVAVLMVGGPGSGKTTYMKSVTDADFLERVMNFC